MLFFRKNTNKNKNKIEFSKIIAIIILTMTFIFLLFVCYMTYATKNLDAIVSIGVSVIGLCATTITFYYNKSKLENKLKIEIKKIREMSKLKKKYKDNFINDEINLDNSDNEIENNENGEG